MSDFEHLGFYELLGVPRSATPEEVKRAYRQEISKYHPDRFANASPAEQEYASRRSQRITEAYSVLNDLASRTAYNRGQSPSRTGSARRAAAPPRDHQAELYEQAREHLVAGRLLQALGALRQLQQINPFYRDSADLLARTEAQFQARQQRKGGRGARRPLFIAGGLIGGAAVVAIIALVVGINRSSSSIIGAAGGTRGATVPAVAVATTVPTAPPLPTVTPFSPTAAPSEPPAPTEPPTEPSPESTPANPLPTEPPAPTEPAPTSPPTPAGESGTLLFADNFASSGWANSSSSGWRVGYQGGRYRVAVDAGYGTIWSYRTAPSGDYSIGVDVRVVKGEGGLLLRFADAGNYLSFSVNPSQTSYRLEQHSGGDIAVLAGGQSEAIQLGADISNRLVTRLSGDHIQLSINGQLLAEVDAPGISSNPRYGLLAIGGDTDADVFFDNLQLRQVEN